MNDKRIQEADVNEAFDAQSSKFDSITTHNPMEVLYRNLAREQVMHYAQKGERLLELNCGTGLDAMYFSEQGLIVHATDNSNGMLEQLQMKLNRSEHPGLSFQKCSFHHLNEIRTEHPFRHVFSNFGGLNCSPDIQSVISQLDALLDKEGMVHLVLIAPICFWELAAVFKGRFRYAFRRLKKNGVRSKIEDRYFTTYYYSAKQIRKYFGKQYSMMELKSLGCFLPPTYKPGFPEKWPGLYKMLLWIETRLNSKWPFNRFGDLYIISMKKKTIR